MINQKKFKVFVEKNLKKMRVIFIDDDLNGLILFDETFFLYKFEKDLSENDNFEEVTNETLIQLLVDYHNKYISYSRIHLYPRELLEKKIDLADYFLCADNDNYDIPEFKSELISKEELESLGATVDESMIDLYNKFINE